MTNKRSHARPTDPDRFGPWFVRERMIGFQKDLEICLTARPHPTENRTTVAFSPALGTCCGTLDFLSCLYHGRLGKQINVDLIAAYSRRYLPQPDYNKDAVRMLFSKMFRHAVAHRGIVSGVFPDQASGRRYAWKLDTTKASPAVSVEAESGEDDRGPWSCRHTHRALIHLGRLWRDIRDSAYSYADDLPSNTMLNERFLRCMEYLYPK